MILSNDYAARAASRGACEEAVAWMDKARHLSLRAMWNLCPRWGWMAFAVDHGKPLSLLDRAIDTVLEAPFTSMRDDTRIYREALPWAAAGPRVRAWLGLPAKEETR